VKGLQLACLLLIGSLFALTGLRQFFVEPLDGPLPNTLWFVIQVAPLLAVLPGVLRGRHRGYFFAVLAASLYFVHGTLEAASVDQRQMGLWEVGFAVALVAVASAAMRRSREGASTRADRTGGDP
jgi:uncharacterized membrane protein